MRSVTSSFLLRRLDMTRSYRIRHVPAFASQPSFVSSAVDNLCNTMRIVAVGCRPYDATTRAMTQTRTQTQAATSELGGRFATTSPTLPTVCEVRWIAPTPAMSTHNATHANIGNDVAPRLTVPPGRLFHAFSHQGHLQPRRIRR
jgi:hypothetical protein